MRASALFAPCLLAALAAACATLGTASQGDVNLPTSNIGPFRKLASTEVLGTAPYVLDNPIAAYREPAALALDADPTSLRVALYAVAKEPGAAPHDAIVRMHADDARSFYGATLAQDGQPGVVLSPDAPWEGGGVRSPSVLRVGASVYMFYAAAGGIGMAVSSDGVVFQKHAGPVLAPDPTVAWETTAPAEPSVAVFPDGTWHMLYAAGVSIGEATSADGATWTRLDADASTPAMDPVLSPLPFDPSSVGPDGAVPFDVGQVAGPCLAPRVTPAGRLQVRVLYAGYDAASGVVGRNSAIGLAARYGDSGRLERAASTVYAVGKHESAPAVFEWGSGAMLYVEQDEGGAQGQAVYRSVAGGIAPANVSLGKPVGYPAGP